MRRKFTIMILKRVALLLVMGLIGQSLIAQNSSGIFFQAVARDNYANPAKDRKIVVQSTIIQSTATGTKVLIEEHQSITDGSGVFSINIGSGVRIGGTSKDIASIDWSKGPFYLNLKVAITPVASDVNWNYTKELIDMGTTSFGAVPFALYAANAGGVSQKLNINDTTNMLAVYAKAMSVKTLETAVASKLTAADTLTMLAPYAKAAYTIDSSFFKTQLATKLSLSDSATKYITPAQLANYNFSTGGSTFDTTSLSNRIDLKANATDITTALNLKASASDVTTALNLKASAADVTTGLALKLDASQKGVANGVATLNASGIIPSSQLPPVTISSTSVVSSEADMIALSGATVGSIAIRTDVNKNYVLSATPASTLGNWIELLTPAAPVQTVNGYSGAVNLSKTDLGLGNVDNTTDVSKPVSSATQAALNLKLDESKVGVASGVASLNALGKIPTDQIPAISFSSVKVLASQSDMLALSSAVVGSVVIRTDVNKNYVLSALPATTLGNWIELLTPAPPVQTVNGYSGNVAIAKSDIGLGNVDNTSDASKPISTATQTALNLKANSTDMTSALALKAPLASPTFTGTVNTSTINTGALSATSIFAPTYASTPKTLTYTGSTINWNPAQGLNAAITLTQASTLSFTNAPPVGSYGTVVLTQDATGSRTLTLPTITGVTNKVLGSTSTSTVALSTAANAKDILNFYYDGTNCYWNIGQGYGAATTTSSSSTTLTGDLTGTGSGAITTTLANTAVTAGSYGSSTAIPTFTVDSKGRLTAASTVGITAGVNSLNYTNTTTYAAGGTISGTTLTLSPADGTNPGLISTGAQTIAGAKTFNSDITVNGMTFGRGAGAIQYNTALGIASLAFNSTGTGNTTSGYASLYKNQTGSDNTGLGQASLFENLIGNGNTGVGSYSLQYNTGNNNTGVGAYSLQRNTADNNTAIGNSTLSNNTIGTNNIAQGFAALTNNTTGSDNIGLGKFALVTNTIGNFNTAIGSNADANSNNLNNTTTIGYGARASASNTIQLGADGSSFVANGVTYPTTAISNVKTTGTLTLGAVTYPNTHGTANQVLSTTGSGTLIWTTPASSGVPYSGATAAVNLGAYDLTVNGISIGRGNSGLSYNTVVGLAALNANTTGNYNNAFGSQALAANLNGNFNSAFGQTALFKNTSGSDNSAYGFNALNGNTIGSSNSAIGSNSLVNSTTGSGNSALGMSALAANTTGSNNTGVGYQANVAANNLTNATAIGYGATVSASNTIQLGNANVTNVNTNGGLTAANVTTPIYASTPQVLTDGSTVVWNPTLGLNASVTLGGNRTLNFSGLLIAGSYGTLVVTQDATGGRTLTLPSVNNKVLGSSSTTTIALSTAAGAKDIVNFYYDGTNYFWNVGQGYGSASSSSTNLATGVTGTLPVANGGTGAATLTANNVLLGNGTSALQAVAPGSSGNVLTSNGTTWTSAAAGVPYSGATAAVDLGAFDLTVNGMRIGKGIGTVNIQNTNFGVETLNSNTTGAANTAIGHNSLKSNTSGTNNTALGQASEFNNTGGNNNTAVGNASLYDNISGSANTALGKSALQYNKSSNNTAIGAYADVNDPTTITNSVAIGHGARVKASNTIQLGADGTTLNTGQLPTTAIENVKTSGTLTLKDVTYPNTHGASGQVLSTNGSGTLIWTTPSSGGSGGHYVGEVYGGGIVFYITTGGYHGLIASSTDIVSNPMVIFDRATSPDYKFATNQENLYTDWKTPTFSQLNILYSARATVGLNLGSYFYISTTMTDNDAFGFKGINFSNNASGYANGNWSSGSSGGEIRGRAIRTF